MEVSVSYDLNNMNSSGQHSDATFNLVLQSLLLCSLLPVYKWNDTDIDSNPPKFCSFYNLLRYSPHVGLTVYPVLFSLSFSGGWGHFFHCNTKKCGRAWFLFRINLILKEDNLAPHQSVMFCQQASGYLEGGKLCLNDPLCCWCSVIHSSIRLTEYTHRTVI